MSFLKRFARYADLIPISLMIVFSFYFSVEVPASDDWDIVPIINKIHQGTLDWNTLDTPYAGHKIDIPYLTLSGIAIATHWNTYAFRIFNIVIFLGAWLAIRPYALRHNCLFAASLLFWTWNQWIAWIFTAAMFCTMSIFCVLWSLRMFESKRSFNFLLGAILAVLGTYCHGTGLAVWPAALYLMFSGDRPRWQRAALPAAMLLALYGFLHHPASHANVQVQYVRGVNFLHMPPFFLIGLGAAVAFPLKGISSIVALGGLILLAVGTPWRKQSEQRFVTAMLVACLAMMGLVMVARGGGANIIGGADSRYGTISALFWTALILLVEWTGWKRYALATLLALCVIRDVSRLPVMITYRHNEEIERRGLIEWTPDRFVLKGSYTAPQEFDSDAKLMRAWHYSLFRGQ
jgi:hypothetical protein